MLGSGGMARAYLPAFCAVRNISKVKVYSPTKNHRDAFAEEMGRELGIPVEPFDRAEPDPGLNGRRVEEMRGKVLGGSSSINGMFYMRGHSRDFDTWRQMGCGR